jgi:adenylylsulfate kinase
MTGPVSAVSPLASTSAPSGVTVWLTGLPSSGKSTLAAGLAERLRAEGRLVEVLDGDEVRANIAPELGFTKEDRQENVRRIGWLAQLLARNGVTVLVPVIAPYAQARAGVRERHAAQGTPYFEVHVATPVGVCAARDVKGLYAKQARGEISGLTGVDDPYEAPVDPELRLDTHEQPIAASVAALSAALSGRRLI